MGTQRGRNDRVEQPIRVPRSDESLWYRIDGDRVAASYQQPEETEEPEQPEPPEEIESDEQ